MHLHATPSVEYIYFNHGKPQFKEAAVRQALYAGVDKRAIIDQIYYGIQKPVEGYLPATSWAFNADLPYLPIFAYVRLEGVKQGLLNYKPNSNTITSTWNMHEWAWK